MTDENQDQEEDKQSITKTITIISYGHSNKAPKTYPDSIIFDVRDFSEVDREELSDDLSEELSGEENKGNNGISAEYQDALMKTESNQILYDNIFNELKEKLLPILNSPDEEIIKVFICGEYGIHRSVAVAEILAINLKTGLDSMGIENLSDKSVDICAEHRDIDLCKNDGEKSFYRKNKKLLNQDRSRRRDNKSKKRYG
jgi:RNase adaptor protein for sRNA GlmZ degradation